MTNLKTEAEATALSGGCIAVALIGVLHDRGILQLEDVREILDSALDRVSTAPVDERKIATGILRTMKLGRFRVPD